MNNYREGDIVNYITTCDYTGDVLKRVKCRVSEVLLANGSYIYELDLLTDRVNGNCSVVTQAEHIEPCLRLVA